MYSFTIEYDKIKKKHMIWCSTYNYVKFSYKYGMNKHQTTNYNLKVINIKLSKTNPQLQNKTISYRKTNYEMTRSNVSQVMC